MDYFVIDCHTHIYPDKVAARAVESIGAFYDIPMQLDGTVDTLIAESKKAGIGKCVALAVAVDAAHVGRVNDFLIASVNAHPDFLYGFATLHPDMEDPGKEVERVLKAGMKGVKLHPDMQHFSLAEPRTEKLFAACQGVCPMLFHTGDSRYHNSNPSLIPPILKKYPRLQLICAHFGGYSEWDSAAACLSDVPVFLDTSSTLQMIPREKARALIDRFGEDRLIFGTDYPMWNAQKEIDIILSLGLSSPALQKIFSQNLLGLLGE